MIDWLIDNKEFYELLLSMVGLVGSGVAIIISIATNKKQVKLALFTERYQIFISCNKFISNIIMNSKCEPSQLNTLLFETNKSEFLFDKEITEFIAELYSKGNELVLLIDVKKDYMHIYKWFKEALHRSNRIFSKYLKM